MNQSNMQIDLKNIEGIKNLVDEGGYDIEQILSVLNALGSNAGLRTRLSNSSRACETEFGGTKTWKWTSSNPVAALLLPPRASISLSKSPSLRS